MRRVLTATLLLLLLLPSGRALAGDNASDLLVDACRDEKVDGTYSQRTYKRALSQLPADSDQYTACRDVINRARLAALNNRRRAGNGTGGGGGASGGGSSGGRGGASNSAGSSGSASGGGSSNASARPTPAERRAVEKAITAGATPVRVGGQLVQPGAVGSLSSDHRRLPTSLIALLIALGACGLAFAAARGWSRVLARRIH
jgi:hypothetical protein